MSQAETSQCTISLTSFMGLNFLMSVSCLVGFSDKRRDSESVRRQTMSISEPGRRSPVADDPNTLISRVPWNVSDTIDSMDSTSLVRDFISFVVGWTRLEKFRISLWRRTRGCSVEEGRVCRSQGGRPLGSKD